MKVKDFLEMDIAEIAMYYDSKQPAEKKAAPKATEPMNEPVEPDAAQDEAAPTKYNGEGNPMKLRKMCKERGIDAVASKKAPYYVAILLKDDEENGSKPAAKAAPAKAAAKPKATGKSLTEETYDSSETYTEEQLRAVSSRGLYNICRKVFDIPREKLKNKDDYIREILNAQGGGAAVAEDEETAGKYDGMKAKELYAECKARGINVQPKKESAFYREVLEANDEEEAAKKKKKEAAKSKPVVEEVAEDEVVDYDSMKAVDLYKLCVKRKIDAEIKQSKDYYIELLMADDEPEEEDGESWGEDVDDEDSGDAWDL